MFTVCGLRITNDMTLIRELTAITRSWSEIGHVATHKRVVVKMSDVAFGSDMESDSGRSSVDVPCGASDGGASGSSSVKTDGVETEQLSMRVESLQQENRVLRMELETMRYRCKGLEQENKDLKRARVNIVRDLL